MQRKQSKRDKVVCLGWNVPVDLKFSFQAEARRRHLMDQEALEQAMRLWLGGKESVTRLSPRSIKIFERFLFNPSREGDKQLGDLLSHILEHDVED